MDYSIIQVLPHLNTLDKEHVKKWAQEFDNLTKLAEIYDDEKLYRLAYQVTDGEARKTLTELKEELGDEYPTFDDITDALLKVKDLTKIEKYDMLKTMVIDRAESIKEFNKTYLELYDSMDDGFKQGIKVTDYLNSIYPRSDACCAVIYDEADSIEKACKSAEKAETLLEYKQRRNNRKNNYPPFNMDIKKKRPTITHLTFNVTVLAPGLLTKHPNQVQLVTNDSNTRHLFFIKACYAIGAEKKDIKVINVLTVMNS